MVETVNKILENAKSAYRESIKIDNDLLEEKPLSIIGDSKFLINELKHSKIKRTVKPRNTTISESSVSNEVQKVERRVPLWMNRPTQHNSIILNTYMKLSNNNQTSITPSLLERHSNTDKFITNYNQMKMIADKNHAKVFEENNGMLQLWEPIAEFVVKQYKQ